MLDAAEVVSGVYDGAAYAGPIPGAQPVTGLGDNINVRGFVNLGFLSNETPPELTMPGAGTATPLRVWQGARVIRTLHAPSEDRPTFDLTLLQQDPAVIELALGVNVSSLGAGELYYVIDSDAPRKPFRFVLDVISAQIAKRYYAPNAIVTTVGGQVFDNSGEPIGYPVTISCDYSSEIGGEVAVWQRRVNPDGAVPLMQPFDFDAVRAFPVPDDVVVLADDVAELADDAVELARDAELVAA